MFQFTNPGKVLLGDARSGELWKGIDKKWDYCFLDPPYEDYPLIEDLLSSVFRTKKNGAAITMFLYPEDVGRIPRNYRPDQIVHWVKPVSTRNTAKSYSRFVEAICVWHGSFFNAELHWSTKTGVFTDSIIKKGYIYQKPQSLVEKLIRLHCPPGGSIIDPCCGSGTVKKVCDRTGYRSLSVEISNSVIINELERI